MTSLVELQQQMRDAIFESGRDGAALQAAGALVAPGSSLPAEEQVLIYRHAILATLGRTLEAIYPVCRALVGEEFFDAMGRVHVRQYPSESPDLGDYGMHFADFIAGFEPAAELPYLPDVARLEWAWHRAFHAADEPPLDIAALDQVPADETGRLIFRLPQSARLLESDYPVQTIWQVNQPDWTGDTAVDLERGGCRLMIWRQGHDMRIDEPDSGEWALLQLIENGLTLDQIGQQPGLEQLDALLPVCVQRGWVAGFTVDAAAPPA